MRQSWPPRVGDRAEVDARDDPTAALLDRDLGHAEPAGGVAPLIRAPLRLRANDHGRVAIDPDTQVLPGERLVPQVAGQPPAEVLLLVEHEAQRPDQHEIVRQQSPKGRGIPQRLGVRPPLSELPDLFLRICLLTVFCHAHPRYGRAETPRIARIAGSAAEGSGRKGRRIFGAHAAHLRRWLLRCSVTPSTALPVLLGAATGSWTT